MPEENLNIRVENNGDQTVKTPRKFAKGDIVKLTADGEKCFNAASIGRRCHGRVTGFSRNVNGEACTTVAWAGLSYKSRETLHDGLLDHAR